MTLSALLMAVAIIIPMFSPIQIRIEPASFTLASHVAIMIAMFLSPTIAVSVELGASLGFFLAGFPLVVVWRAASQIVFVLIGAFLLKKKPGIMNNWAGMIGFSVTMGIIHAVCEVIVCLPFYTTMSLTQMVYPIFVLVGVGTFVHSCVDFTIAVVVWKYLLKARNVEKFAVVKTLPI